MFIVLHNQPVTNFFVFCGDCMYKKTSIFKKVMILVKKFGCVWRKLYGYRIIILKLFHDSYWKICQSTLKIMNGYTGK